MRRKLCGPEKALAFLQVCNHFKKLHGVTELIEKVRPIRVVHCELKELKDAPFHWKDSDVEGEIEVFEEFKDGLMGVERFQM